VLPIKSAPTWFATLVISLLSITAQADIVGTHAASGVLNFTFHKQGIAPVKTVATSNETWVFNSDNSFSRGDLSGTWSQKNQKLAVAKYNRQAYKDHLTAFWNSLGVIVSDVRIEENKLAIREVSNGYSIEESLVYRVKVAENGGNVPAKISIQGSFVVASDGAENQALLDAFSTMQPAQSGQSSGAVDLFVGGVSGFSGGNLNLIVSGPDPEVTTPPDNQAPPSP
jgi:hypothetical protein